MAAINTTEPKIRDQFGSLIDNPNYSPISGIPSVSSQMAANEAGAKKAAELPYMSTDLAASYVQKDQAELDRMSGKVPAVPGVAGAPSTAVPPKPVVQPAPTPGKIKYINMAGQTTELNGGAITPDAVQKLLNQGFYSVDVMGDVPSWATTGDVESGRLSAQLAEAKKQKDDLIAGMAKFMVTDEQLAAQLKGIESVFDSRITSMQDINRRREASLKTTGLRIGSRYTGGDGGVFGGIVTEEERQGVSRITELEAQKQAAIAAARDAARTGNWKIYEQQVSAAQSTYKDQVAAVTEFNKTLAENNKKIAEDAQKLRERDQQAARDTSVAALLAQGVNDPVQMLGFLNSAGGNFTAKDIADGIKNLQIAEETSPGIVGEWQAALRTGGLPEGTTLMDYMDIKDPGRALDMQQKVLQIAKLQKELEGGGINEDPLNMLAYAQQYAATGMIPTGLPKGTFGMVANTAKELPKLPGAIVDRNTGIKSSATSDTLQGAYGSLYSVISLAQELKELDKKRWGGLVAGTVGKVLGSEDQKIYVDTVAQIVDLLARARSGAALTTTEEARYSDMLPGRFNNPLGIGADSQVRIDNFVKNLSADLDAKTRTQGLAIYGFSKVPVQTAKGEKMYTVGDVVANDKGEMGRINPDGTITLLNQ